MMVFLIIENVDYKKFKKKKTFAFASIDPLLLLALHLYSPSSSIFKFSINKTLPFLNVKNFR